MRFSHFCIDRPIFATVLSILIVLLGAAAYFTLPVAQYPGDRAADDRDPRQLSGRLGRGRLQHRRDADRAGDQRRRGHALHDLAGDRRRPAAASPSPSRSAPISNTAQVLVQNRVAVAESRLPEEVRRIGVTVRKSSPDMLMVIHLSSSDGSRDPLYISNYATLQVRDVLARLDGVGDVRIFGARDYSMRIWLDPEKVASRNLTAGEVVAALRAQNVQVASGVLNQPPVPRAGRLPAQRRDARPALRAAPVRQHRRQDRRRRPRHAARGHRPGRARGAGLHRQRLSRRAAGGAAADLPAPGLERARHRRPADRDDGRSCRRTFRRACNTTSSTTRPSSSPNRSTR